MKYYTLFKHKATNILEVRLTIDIVAKTMKANTYVPNAFRSVNQCDANMWTQVG